MVGADADVLTSQRWWDGPFRFDPGGARWMPPGSVVGAGAGCTSAKRTRRWLAARRGSAATPPGGRQAPSLGSRCALPCGGYLDAKAPAHHLRLPWRSAGIESKRRIQRIIATRRLLVRDDVAVDLGAESVACSVRDRSLDRSHARGHPSRHSRSSCEHVKMRAARDSSAGSAAALHPVSSSSVPDRGGRPPSGAGS